jgi:hypothetical protein
MVLSMARPHRHPKTGIYLHRLVAMAEWNFVANVAA